jgi:hypothetical protein
MYGWVKTQPATTFDTLDSLIKKIANVTGSGTGDDPGAGGGKRDLIPRRGSHGGSL